MKYLLFFGILATIFVYASMPSRAAAGDVEICDGQDLSERIAACSRLIKSGSLPERKLSRTHNSRGMGYVMLGDIDRGISDFDKAIRFDPDFAMPYYNRGYALVFQIKLDQAEVDFAKAIKANPNWESPYIGRAVVKFMRGSSDGAIADLSSAIAINPNSAEAYVNRGVVYRVNGQIAKALSDFKMALKIDPFNKDAQFQIRELSIDPGPIMRHPASSGSPANIGVKLSKLHGGQMVQCIPCR
jgi:tetratricopeptide (TPR) repeat protein